jgi:hypothetical protein
MEKLWPERKRLSTTVESLCNLMERLSATMEKLSALMERLSTTKKSNSGWLKSDFLRENLIPDFAILCHLRK